MTKLGSVEYSRPVSGEPLALDLINTAWPDGEGLRDVLASRSGHEEWLRENDLPGPSTAAARKALLQARDAIRAALETPGPAALAALDGISSAAACAFRPQAQCKGGGRGRARVAGAVACRPQLLLRLVDEHHSRVRNCANPDVSGSSTPRVRNAPLVLHDRLRESPQGPTPLPAAASR